MYRASRSRSWHRAQRELLLVVIPRVEYLGADRSHIADGSCNQKEVVFERGCREERVDHRRRAPGQPLGRSRNNTSPPHDRVADRQDPSGKPTRQPVSGGDEPRPAGVVVRYVVDALVVLTQGQDAEEKPVFVLGCGPSLNGRSAVRVDDRADDIGVEKPPDHNSASRP